MTTHHPSLVSVILNHPNGSENKDPGPCGREACGDVQEGGKRFPRLDKTCLQWILKSIQTDCGDCDIPSWIDPSNNTRTTPPQNTVAIVIDVRNNRGAVYIHETQGGKHVDGVGTENSRNLVMVPWNSDWYYYSIGSIRLAYIGKKNSQ